MRKIVPSKTSSLEATTLTKHLKKSYKFLSHAKKWAVISLTNSQNIG